MKNRLFRIALTQGQDFQCYEAALFAQKKYTKIIGDKLNTVEQVGNPAGDISLMAQAI